MLISNMTSRYWNTIHNFDFDWESVVNTFWKKYPNPNSSHVFSEDIISNTIDKNGCLHTKRVIVKTNSLPSWGEHLFTTRNVWLIEESIVDPKRKIMTVYTRNLNLRVFMGTTERMTLTPIDNDSTKADKEVWIESEIYGLRSAIKSFGVDRFKKNCVKATQGYEWALKNNCKSQNC